MITIINSIEDALEKECYLPALALALTIPDICGEAAYPDLVDGKGRRLVGEQYRTWFDDWASKYFADHTGYSEDYKKAKNPYFTKVMCYELRCAYLHNGKTIIPNFGVNTDDEWDYLYSFELCINGLDMFGETWGSHSHNNNKKVKEIHVRVNIQKLCESLCLAAREYFKSNEGFGFENTRISVRDIEKEYEFINKTNS
ncbi:hypothetical protein HB943_15345 [Listeria weihenstephanensis]|uniref:Uncharacterized protein n=1 Tax=Listeria weihenstephanensis TaxID=1006155 RepID=A0A841Z9I3_9LIST|nr:hypothetical protein [Listeria weihenstephanensis]MBC1501975.1 hypothetical protein [Listeria weihenstephanensis]